MTVLSFCTRPRTTTFQKLNLFPTLRNNVEEMPTHAGFEVLIAVVIHRKSIDVSEEHTPPSSWSNKPSKIPE
jgi:hypothetical protein